MNLNPKPVRLVLADDHPLVRAGIRSELDKLPSVEVVAEAKDGREAMEQVQSLQPDAVFMDISMPGLNGLEAVARIHRDFPAMRIIVLSMHENEEYVSRALKAGACAYLLKREATAELAVALDQVMKGKTYFSQAISHQVLRRQPPEQMAGRADPLERLTDRQREILQLIAEGKNTKEIGGILDISPKTVEYHRMKLMESLNVHDVPGLVRFAMREGVIAPDS